MKTSVNKTCLIGPAIKPEQFVAEHLFFYLVSGQISGYSGGKYHTLQSGEYGLMRKNRLGRIDSSKESRPAEKIIFVFDELFLKTFQSKHQINLIKFKSDASFLQFEDNELIPNFIRSLIPYYNADGQMDKAFFDVKREELLLILLQKKVSEIRMIWKNTTK